MSYKIGFDGVVTAQLDRLLQSVEKGVNGFGGLHVQGTGMEASAGASGSTDLPPCPSGYTCSYSVKGGHDFKGGHDAVVIAIVIAIVVGAVAGYVAGKLAAQRVILSVKGGHD